MCFARLQPTAALLRDVFALVPPSVSVFPCFSLRGQISWSAVKQVGTLPGVAPAAGREMWGCEVGFVLLSR